MTDRICAAFSGWYEGMVLWADGAVAQTVTSEVSRYLEFWGDDLLGSPTGAGVFIWEGAIRFGDGDEADLVATGAWRELSPEEWIRFVECSPPWVE